MDLVDADLLTSFDPVEPPTTYFGLLQDARYHHRQLGSPQSATDAVPIRKALAEFKKHTNLASSKRKWQKKATDCANMPAPALPPHTWQEFKTFWLTEFQKAEGLANNAVEAKIAPLREANEATASAVLAQQSLIKDLSAQVLALTNASANQANVVAPAAPAAAATTPATPAQPANINKLFEHSYIMVSYDYDLNVINPTAIRCREDDALIAGYEELYSHLTKAGITSLLHKLDNEASK